ncbi:hypothetical protein [Brevundimonas sp.]|uniref:hypothetical protein n=1 Tax=Brevundimonas sp. TaxID=1871086 RepID=UPI002EDAD185
MSFREKLSWGVLLTTSALWSFYFVRLGLKAADGLLTQNMVVWTLAGCGVVGAALQIGLAILTSVKTSKAERAVVDEHEQGMELRASQAAFLTMAFVLGGLATFAYFQALRHPELLGAEAFAPAMLLAANGVLFALVLAEIVRHATLITLLRRVG